MLVRTTNQPDQEVEVSAREAENLRGQGLLLEEDEDDAESEHDKAQDKRLADLEKKAQAKSQAKTEGS